MSVMHDEPKVAPVDLPLLTRSGFKADRANWFLVWAPLMHKFTNFAFFARIALCQNFSIELARVEHAFCHALLQVGCIRIDFAHHHWTRLFWRQEVSCVDGLPNGFAISSCPTSDLADRDPFAIHLP